MDELLALRAIHKSYRRGQRRLRVLEDVSLTVAAGEIVALVGSRYDGKSTLLEIAAGLSRPDAGEVWYKGRELGSLRAGQRQQLLREEISWVQRADKGLESLVLDDVAMPLHLGRWRSRDVRDRAMSALERVGVQDVARQRWDELSDWERILVAFARGIARKPQLMVIDDLIDGLGMSKTYEAGELLSSLVAELGCGVLMSVSDPEAALVADCVWFFDNGALRLLSDQTAHQSNIIDFPKGSAPQGQGFSGSGA